MSTKYPNVETDQELPSRSPGSLQAEKVPPVPPFPQPPQRPPRPMRNRWVVLGAVIVLLALILSVGGIWLAGQVQRPGSQVKPMPTAPATTTSPTPSGSVTAATPTPGVSPSPQPSPPGVNEPAYWDKIIGTHAGASHVESVTFAHLMGNSSLQALVTVRYTGTDARLDVYVFTDITNAHPKQIFKLVGLVKGDARISGYNTVMTAEVDKNSGLNVGKTVSAMKPDLFREFGWSGKEGTMVQVAFPGIYPDLTRYQAEQDQALVNKGKDTWKNDPAQVAKALASMGFNWTRTLTTKVLSGGGPHDVNAVVQVQEAPVQGGPQQGPTATVTLSRLEGNIHNIWEAIAVQDGSAALTSIPARSLITSPVKLEGKGSAFEGTIGMAYIWDHLYSPIGRAIITGTPGVGMGYTSYSISVSYDSSFKTGAQEGIVEVQLTSPIESDPYAVVMVKVLLNPQPVAVQGPVSCPLVTQQQGYWSHFLGLDPNTSTVGTVSCASMKGDPSLQALVPVFYNDGKPNELYVYDSLTGPRPVQIFKLQTASAMISGYSTILTADIDRNSSINKGKTGDQLTTDLYREFQWSSSAKTFVQVAFPGIFPDLTRWQAEQDQLSVNQGQDTWKNDPSQVARNLAVKLLNWSNNAQTTVLSGGGPNDVNAVVQVKSAAPDHPAIKVTLSRLEGNTHNLWVAISVTTDGMSITSPQKWATLTSPAQIKGTGGAFEGDVGTVFVLDHLYTDIGHAKGIPANNGKTSFTASISYNASFHGTQEGVLAFYRYSEADGSIAGVVMLKVLISG
jgi:Immunoglobulin-like domain of bacterial spore germination